MNCDIYRSQICSAEKWQPPHHIRYIPACKHNEWAQMTHTGDE